MRGVAITKIVRLEILQKARRSSIFGSHRRIAMSSLAAQLLFFSTSSVNAYTAAGDRQFAASIILPQVGPSDALYLQGASYPEQSDDVPTSSMQETTVYGELDKTISEDVSVGIIDGYTARGQVGTNDSYGWQNFAAAVKYRAVLDQAHEFLFTLEVVREFGHTGAEGVEAQPWGATTPMLAFGKGLGDLDIGYLRPLAIVGTLGAELADRAPRPNLLKTGFAIEYSIPYLESEVETLALPHFLRAMTPMVEFLFVNPIGRDYGTRATGVIAPGVSYGGEGWELGADFLIPTTRATATGLGFRVQLALSFDFLFPNSLGKPLLGR
jgi:hypothetical protein